MDIAKAYETAAGWRDKQAEGCKAMAVDDPRLGADIRAKAGEAAKHHSASAAGLRLAALNLRRAAMSA